MIYTSYFANVKRISEARPDMVFVSIAGKSPDWIAGAGVKFVKYGKLAPRWAWWSEWKKKFGENPESAESMEWYKKKYSDTILSKLDPAAVAAELESLADGSELCLLCWEAPGKFCHRRLVADWLGSAGITCPEFKK